MGMPAWEVPFYDIGKVLLALPEALEKTAQVIGAIEQALPAPVAALITLLEDSAVAITDKGLNIVVDGKVANDFLAALAACKALIGTVQGATANPTPAKAQS